MSDLVLYNYFRSSASYRVRIALNLKNLEYEYKPVHLLNNGGEQHGDAYRSLNPSRQVPTLIHKGRALGQSMAIIDYLDQIAPEPRLFPKDPFQRAHVLQVCEIINSGIQPLHNLRVLQELGSQFKADQDAKNLWSAGWIERGFETLENALKPLAKLFSFGDEITAADVFLIPQVFSAARNNVSLKSFPTIERINKNCLEIEAFKRAAPDSQPDTP